MALDDMVKAGYKFAGLSTHEKGRVVDRDTPPEVALTVGNEIRKMATVDTYFCIPDNSSKNNLELYGSKGSIIAQGTLGQGDSGNMTAYLEDELTSYNAKQERKTGADWLLIRNL